MLWTLANHTTVVAYALIPVALIVAIWRARSEDLPGGLIASIALVSAFVWACSLDHLLHGPPMQISPFQRWVHVGEAAVSALTALLFLASTGALRRWLHLRTTASTQARLIRQLEDANRDLNDFARAASHDLRAPIRNVLTYAELLEEEAEPEQTGYVFRIKEAAAHMLGLLEGMLSYTGLRSDKLVREPVDLDALCRQIEDELHLAEGRLQWGKLGSVQADPVQMYQALTNLITNANKFSPPEAPIEVRVSRRNGHVDISVTDHGEGIEDRHLDQVLKPFARLNSNTEGAGLGLAIVSRIAERHHGTLKVSSRVGEGSTFTLSIPHDTD